MRKKYKLFFYSGLAIHLHLLFSNSLQSEGFTYLQGLNLKPSIRTLKFQGSKKTFVNTSSYLPHLKHFSHKINESIAS